MTKVFLHSPLALYTLLFPARLMVGTLLERWFVAHKFNPRTVIALDITAMFFFVAIIFPAAQYVSNLIGYRAPIPHEIDSVPLPLRVAMYLTVADFGHYWLHRLMHQPFLWRIHKWHHSPTHMSWTAGARETFLDATVVNLAYIFAWPLLGTISHRVELLLLAFVVLKNDWMHLNVSWRLPWLEWLIVTPRYHHIHHSSDPAHLGKNLAPLFSIWDRLFGTHLDPEIGKERLSFGIGEKVSSIRLVLGV